MHGSLSWLVRATSLADLVDAIWAHVRAGGRLDPATADLVALLADRTCQLWRVRELVEAGQLASLHADVDAIRAELSVGAAIAVQRTGHDPAIKHLTRRETPTTA
ncbi:MAG: hypothetical protein L0H41_00400 [Microlunatus sp.]|nr:hypothetical protein [Microlunatus sp.]